MLDSIPLPLLHSINVTLLGGAALVIVHPLRHSVLGYGVGSSDTLPRPPGRLPPAEQHKARRQHPSPPQPSACGMYHRMCGMYFSTPATAV